MEENGAKKVGPLTIGKRYSYSPENPLPIAMKENSSCLLPDPGRTQRLLPLHSVSEIPLNKEGGLTRAHGGSKLN